MEAKSIERIAEELGVNFYNLHPLIVTRDEFHRRAGIREVVEWIYEHNGHGKSYWLFQTIAGQAKLKEWDIK